ncbi:MAG TPA: lipid-A-disaccharide synthase [Alphaproteobacteria bacterium]|nr:lipid-A-disaccharide synthase [Alphaproteobacteria bacterium]
MTEDAPLRVMIIAGEPSGDLLGAELLAALRMRCARKVEAFGIGGGALIQAGLTSLFPMSDLSVMGVSEVVPRLPLIQMRIAQTVGAALERHPDLVLTIDSPDFCFRVARRLRAANPDMPIVHYVAPHVWAWRQGRAQKIARYVDLLLTLLPFEPDIFIKAGLPARFVGHPVVTRVADQCHSKDFRARHNIGDDVPLLAVLPGSRQSEVDRLLPVFGQAIALLHAQFPQLHLFCATVDSVAETVTETAADWGCPVIFAADADEKFAGFAACDAAIAASGTVSLELAVAGTPHIVGYRLNPVTAFLAKRLLRVPYVNLVNLILGESEIPELLAGECTPQAIAAAIAPLLSDHSPARRKQMEAMSAALHALGQGQMPPSQRAADAVCAFLNERGIAT